MKRFLIDLLDVLREPLALLKVALAFIIGQLNYQLIYLFVVMVVDLIFGIQVARKNGEFKFQILFNKFFTKTVMYLMWVTMFHAFDMVSGLPDTARWSVILVLVGLEMFSAIKNTSKLGYSNLADALEKLYLSLVKNKGGMQSEKPKKPRKPRAKKPKPEDTESE